MQRTVLLNPGPVNVTERVRKALLKADLCHREEEFSQLMGSIREKLIRAFGIETEYTAVLISGSGTAALEMAVSCCLKPDRSMLVIENGVYGERIGTMADTYELPRHTVKHAWGETVRLADVEQALKAHPDIEVVAMVHHETTTGLLNPLKEVSALAEKYEKKLLVDCISSLAGDAIDFSALSIDFAAGTANKCIQGLPGVSFVLFRKKDLCRLAQIPARSVYFNLVKHHGAQEAGDTLFTPSVQIHYAFEEALNELIEETMSSRIERYKNAAHRFRRGFEAMGLDILIAPEQRSNGLTALRLPEGMTYSTLHGQLKKAGFVIYAGQGALSERIFRIANMGDITHEEIDRCLEVMEDCFSAAHKDRG